MSKKGGGFLQPFDFNFDGKVDPGEMWLGLMLFQEINKTDSDSYSSFGSDFDIDDSLALYDDEYAWRDTTESNRYGISPERYETEAEYLEAVNEAKYAWRDTTEINEYGVSIYDYETETDYLIAVNNAKHKELEKKSKKKYEEERQRSFEEESKKRKQREAELLKDTNIYTYCGVKLPFSDRPYSYRTDDDTIKIGDEVIVTVGNNNEEMIGVVVSKGQYFRIAVPFPLEMTKFIKGKPSHEKKE